MGNYVGDNRELDEIRNKQKQHRAESDKDLAKKAGSSFTEDLRKKKKKKTYVMIRRQTHWPFFSRELCRKAPILGANLKGGQ